MTARSRSGRRWWRWAGVLLPLAAALFSGTGCLSHPPAPGTLNTRGVRYQFHSWDKPRPIRAHSLRVDLTAGHVEPVVVIAPDPDGAGPAEAILTDPLALASNRPVLAFINTNPWDAIPDAAGTKNRHWYAGQPVEISGLAATHRQAASAADKGNGAVWLDSKGMAHLGVATPDADVVEGVCGFGMILKEGVVTTKPSNRLNPLTGIGVDAKGRTLWLVVVDGRQSGFSEGMTNHELALFLKELGCWNGAVMDGGGSSVMGLAGADGKLRIVNSPSDRFLAFPVVRPLPLILTLQKRQ
jgi:hypothetical protein